MAKSNRPGLSAPSFRRRALLPDAGDQHPGQRIRARPDPRPTQSVDGHGGGELMGGCTHPASSRLGKVHVWTAWLVDDDDTTAHHVGILDADERARADAFQRPWDRGRFVQSHGIVRRLLARYT